MCVRCDYLFKFCKSYTVKLDLSTESLLNTDKKFYVRNIIL